MNANSPLLAPVIKSWLKSTSQQLETAGIASARLDAELILAHALQKERTYLHAHADDLLELTVQQMADTQLARRLKYVPIAYIVGYKEFYGRCFSVTTDTLIPRPESEDIINLLKRTLPSTTYHLSPTTLRLIDVGTGSGCLGITAKLEFPELKVTLTDISPPALEVARTNAQRLHADVALLESDLLQSYHLQADIIIANLPYVDSAWEVSPDTIHEPSIALFADDGGLTLLRKLIDQAVSVLTPQGLLLLEADPRQHRLIIARASHQGFRLISKRDYCLALKRT